MKKTSSKGISRLDAILIHFQPAKRGGFGKLDPAKRGLIVGLGSTPPGQKRNKEQDAYNAEREWQRNLSFVCGLYNLIPPASTVLKGEAEDLLLSLFGSGFSADRIARFNTAARQRIKKDGEAAWRLVEKIRRAHGLLK